MTIHFHLRHSDNVTISHAQPNKMYVKPNEIAAWRHEHVSVCESKPKTSSTFHIIVNHVQLPFRNCVCARHDQDGQRQFALIPTTLRAQSHSLSLWLCECGRNCVWQYGCRECLVAWLAGASIYSILYRKRFRSPYLRFFFCLFFVLVCLVFCEATYTYTIWCCNISLCYIFIFCYSYVRRNKNTGFLTTFYCDLISNKWTALIGVQAKWKRITLPACVHAVRCVHVCCVYVRVGVGVSTSDIRQFDCTVNTLAGLALVVYLHCAHRIGAYA